MSEPRPPVPYGALSVAAALSDFVADELLPGASLDADAFWRGFEALIRELAPQNRELLEERDRLQARLDDWHREHAGRPHDAERYQRFLTDIGYLVPEPDDFEITTTDVDSELKDIAGPQLVVPVLNARFVLNAANARWGSLYDALYGSDVIAEGDGAERGSGYNPVRGELVIAFGRRFLDDTFPLLQGSHRDVRSYRVGESGLKVELVDGSITGLVDQTQYRGHRGTLGNPTNVLLANHGLHVDLRFDRDDPIGAGDAAGLAGIEVEAAVTTIVDFEDSVAAVDAEDKVVGYRNWLGLNRGTLTESVTKAGTTFTRSLHEDRHYTAPDGTDLTVPGRALLLVRNVGHLMTSDAITHAELGPVPEGILDAVLTSLAALPGLGADRPRGNSRTGSIYIVKPKMHGPEEVDFSRRLFGAVEELLHLPAGTVKMGIMDEERRTSVNLKAALHAARDRVVFINTGFLDRTGDEIHTSMEAGAMVRKGEMKKQAWITAYEDSNVDTGLAAGLRGRAQIGKGMWAMPDLMADMLEQKIAHPMAGATTAWVPSPTAAVLHALHYHQVDVRKRQDELAGHRRGSLSDLLTIPLAPSTDWSAAEKQKELDNNVQSILGYVVRWIDQGVGCSKVPDIDDIALMEDRATLRISSQLLANWLRHGVISEDQVRDSLQKMAAVVDRQNAGDPTYRPMSEDPSTNIAFQTAQELIVQGTRQPNGYTEPILHRRRREYKASFRPASAERPTSVGAS
jgi:malate synthase